MPPSTTITLRRHKEEQAAIRLMLDNPLTPETLVFSKPHDDSLICLPDSFTHAVAKLGKKAGLGHVNVHMLRHSHASLMLAQNVNIKVLQERLGHADVSTTLQVYGHLLPGAQREAAERFDRALEQSRNAER